MKTMSLNKIGGLCLCVGAALLTIPFLLQITLGGTPEEGSLIWRYFADEITSGGNLTLLYPILSVLGIALLVFGVYTLNSLLQKEKLKNRFRLKNQLYVRQLFFSVRMQHYWA